MSTFKVGQRVRVIRTYTRPDLIGLETRIVAESLLWDWSLEVRDERGINYGAKSHQLEPIIPEGAAPSELSYTELMDRLKAGEGVPA